MLPPLNRACVSLALLIAPCALAAADQSTLRLMCTYSKTVFANGTTTDTSGEVVFTISYEPIGTAKISKEGLGALFSGNVSEDEIIGEVTYALGPVKVSETLRINRFTGSMTLTYFVPGKDGLIHYGKCRNASERLF